MFSAARFCFFFFYFIMVFFIYAEKRMNFLTSVIPIMFHILLKMHKLEASDTAADGVNIYD